MLVQRLKRSKRKPLNDPLDWPERLPQKLLLLPVLPEVLRHIVRPPLLPFRNFRYPQRHHSNTVHAGAARKPCLPLPVVGIAASLLTPATDYLWAMRLRTEALRANEIWEKCDCIFTPVFYHRAPLAAESLTKGFDNMGGDGGPSNLLGWPAMAFPIGFEADSPLGGQIIAPCMREDTCYRVVREFQKETDFHLKRPAGA